MVKYSDMYYVCWLIERMHRTTQNVEKNKPSVRPIAGVYSRIVKNTHPDDYTNGIINVFSSFLPPLISDYGNHLYWANKEYLIESYKAGALL